MADTKPDTKPGTKPGAKPAAPIAKKRRAGGITGGIWWAYAAMGLYFLIFGPAQSALDYLPYLLLMSCPLLDIFKRNSGFRRGDVAKLKPGAPWE